MADQLASAAFAGSGTLAAEARCDGTPLSAWREYERLRQAAVRRREAWEEERAAGGTDGYAASAFSRYYQAEQRCEAAWLAYVEAVAARARSQGVFAGYGGTPFITGSYPVPLQPPSEN